MILQHRTIIILGKPIAKKRPRFARRGNYVAAINDQNTEEGRFWLEAKSQWQGPPWKGAIGIVIFFLMPIPASTSRLKGNRMDSGEIPHIKKPDIDNLIKFCLDCLKNLAWEDDSQIIELRAQKLYGHHTETNILIREVENGLTQEVMRISEEFMNCLCGPPESGGKGEK